VWPGPPPFIADGARRLGPAHDVLGDGQGRVPPRCLRIRGSGLCRRGIETFETVRGSWLGAMPPPKSPEQEGQTTAELTATGPEDDCFSHPDSTLDFHVLLSIKWKNLMDGLPENRRGLNPQVCWISGNRGF